MKVRILREACCAQDDQLGPLEAIYEMADGSSVKELVDAIEKSGFPQYSSSHLAMVGKANTAALFQVFIAITAAARQRSTLCREKPMSNRL